LIVRSEGLVWARNKVGCSFFLWTLDLTFGGFTILCLGEGSNSYILLAMYFQPICLDSQQSLAIQSHSLSTWTAISVKYPLGPLHTRSKSRDHEIVRAQKKCPKAVPRHFQNHVVWSHALKCSVKSYVTGPSTKCYLNEHLLIRVLTHGKIE
jgi:hypothetical protein